MTQWGVNLLLMAALIFVIWNLIHGKRTGRIRLGLLVIDRKWDKRRFYPGAILINLLWAVILLTLLIWRVFQLSTSL